MMRKGLLKNSKKRSFDDLIFDPWMALRETERHKLWMGAALQLSRPILPKDLLSDATFHIRPPPIAPPSMIAPPRHPWWQLRGIYVERNQQALQISP